MQFFVPKKKKKNLLKFAVIFFSCMMREKTDIYSFFLVKFIVHQRNAMTLAFPSASLTFRLSLHIDRQHLKHAFLDTNIEMRAQKSEMWLPSSVYSSLSPLFYSDRRDVRKRKFLIPFTKRTTKEQKFIFCIIRNNMHSEVW